MSKKTKSGAGKASSKPPAANGDVIQLSQLQIGKDDFQSDGFSYLKVTRGGEATVVKLPIRSSGVTELIEAMSRKKPQPPDDRVLVKQASKVGKEMGLSKDKWVIMPNLNDPEYSRKIEAWNVDLTFGIVLTALNIPIVDHEGERVFDPTQKNYDDDDRKIAIDALKTLGFTMDHFTQIALDAQELTDFSEEERARFFGESSDSQSSNGSD